VIKGEKGVGVLPFLLLAGHHGNSRHALDEILVTPGWLLKESCLH
jgi:hypothetical protein